MNVKILIVDDDADAAQLTAVILERAGFDWEICESGGATLDYLAATTEFDAAILDLSMPSLDGLTLAQEIRRNERLRVTKPPIKLAFYTAYDADETVKRTAKLCRVDHIFSKPHDTEILGELVQKWLL